MLQTNPCKSLQSLQGASPQDGVQSEQIEGKDAGGESVDVTWQKKLFWDQKVLWSTKHGTNLNYIGISFESRHICFEKLNFLHLTMPKLQPPKKTFEATEGEGGDSGGSGQSGRQSGDQTGDMGTEGTDQQKHAKT